MTIDESMTGRASRHIPVLHTYDAFFGSFPSQRKLFSREELSLSTLIASIDGSIVDLNPLKRKQKNPESGSRVQRVGIDFSLELGLGGILFLISVAIGSCIKEKNDLASMTLRSCHTTMITHSMISFITVAIAIS